MSMAAKTSDRGDDMTEANLQMDGLQERPAQRAVDCHEMEEEDNSPHNSPMWSPVPRPPTGRLNMNYCLSIQATLTDKLGDVPPPPHAWMALVVEDMLQDTRTGLTEAVVIGPGKAILFYGRRSMGEGLKVDKARDAAFLITGSGTWVGNLTYLTANPMTLLEGRKAISCTISDQGVKARGLGCPRVNPPAQQPFRFNASRTPPPGGLLSQRDSDGMTPRWSIQGRGLNQRRRNQRQRSPRIPSPSPD